MIKGSVNAMSDLVAELAEKGRSLSPEDRSRLKTTTPKKHGDRRFVAG